MKLNQYSVFDIVPDVRLDSWMWLYRRKILKGRIPCDFNLNLGSTLGSTMNYTEYFQLRDSVSTNYLLSIASLEWIVKDKRQIKWGLNYVVSKLECDIPECPPLLEGRNRLIASLDFWDCPLGNKRAAVKAMELAWYELLKEDEIFKWMKDQDASCFEFVWEWLAKKGRTKDFKGPPILNHKDLLKFYDEIGVNSLQKRVDAKDIRSALNSKNNLKKMKSEGKSQFNVRISDQTIEKIENLSVCLKLNRAETIEWLVNREYGDNLSSKKY